MTNYSITVSGAELEVINLAIGRLVPARKIAERKAAEPSPTRPPYDTGNAGLDEWINARRDPSWTDPKPWVAWTFKPRYTRRPLPESFFKVEEQWNRRARQLWNFHGVVVA